MKLKGRRQSANVGRKQDHPTEAARNLPSFRKAEKARRDRELTRDHPHPLAKSAGRAAERGVAATEVKNAAAKRGYDIKQGERKGPRPSQRDAKSAQDKRIKDWAWNKSMDEIRKKLDQRTGKRKGPKP